MKIRRIRINGDHYLVKMKIRANGDYYQIGYYLKGKWINVCHIGTAEQLLKKLNIPVPETYQNVKPKDLPVKPKDLPKSAETYEENQEEE
tara:strand:+ start:739 stop:1008 length:270 start_codon:yes stop_codon:yes gene_type:complete